MSNSNLMILQTFKDAILGNTHKTLRFEYATDLYVDASYHTTEIRRSPIVSVDCGGVMNTWTEILPV